MKNPRTNPPEVVELPIYESIEETLQDFVDLVCGSVLQTGNFAEIIRKRAADIQLADHRRRLERDGKNAITGETPEQYRETITKSGGQHPITGLTVLDVQGDRLAQAAKEKGK
jgi:hypothetical protein